MFGLGEEAIAVTLNVFNRKWNFIGARLMHFSARQMSKKTDYEI